MADVAKFLDKVKLKQYIGDFEENDIDGDILHAIIEKKSIHESDDETTVADHILQELGMKSNTDRLKVKTKFKSFVKSCSEA